MSILSSDRGIIKGYEQNIISTGEKISFTTEDIFHLAWNRLGDECHGRSTIEKLEPIVLMRNEVMGDLKTVFHRYVKPLLITEADTDDETEIAALKVKLDNSVKNGENLIIPKGTVTIDRMSIPKIPP